ncbi:RagB/SusD family nutrient uptake outer membrane protein [Chryseobacterium gambrini]|uniref:RagB/SusD domain-containing protein n=1 Tax=Chryseobacterium gambrini TaxID=373672 RepID=A0A1N7PZZ5_9FLAO|nr:RagB/SusD family nutrient uptake outer membrane protein [Chryseobacterium gambrini]SIT16184.1 RagB/SusD domain-containing protein [Chryseobacterium gambrini]
MKKIFYFFKFVSVVSFIAFVSCEKFIEIDNPIDQLTTDEVFSDSSTVESAILGLYVQQITSGTSGFLNGSVTLYPGLSSDEIYNTSASASFDPFLNNDLSSTTTLSWTNPYNIIYSCNIILEKLESSPLSSSYKERARAEVLFIRALNYFYLVNFYGAVPLSLTSDYRVTSTLARSSEQEVYNQIIADLRAAQNNIGSTNESTTLRVNKWGISALLARFYLYTKQYELAKIEATKVISSGNYLLPDLSNVFLSSSKEAILQFVPPNTQIFGVADAYRFIPSSATARPNFALTESLINSLESGDGRKSKWLNQNTVAGKVYIYPYKYKTRSVVVGAAKPEFNIVLRLAEMYLIRAEASANLGNNSDAISDLNVIRKRALLSELDKNQSISKEDLITIINHENRIEFFAEWGHRWLDLKRTGQVDLVLTNLKGDKWQKTDAVYPVPLSDIRQNPNLTQNEGYN